MEKAEISHKSQGLIQTKQMRRKRGKKATAQGVADVAESVRTPDVQLSMFQLDDPVLVQIRDQIKGLDINSLTPLEALNKLNEIKKIAGI